MKVKAILISAFAAVLGMGAVGGAAAYLLQQNNIFFSSASNSTKALNTNLNNFDGSFGTEVVGKNFNVTIQRQSTSLLTTEKNKDPNQAEYTMKIAQDEASKEEGNIFFVVEGDETHREVITFKPGQKIKVGVTYKDTNKQQQEDKKLTIRELLVWGKNTNHFVKTEKSNDGYYTINMPLVEESTNLDGTNWLYDSGVDISVKATFIKESIGKETKWTHGAYFGDLNGYVYNLRNDAKWSEIKQDVYKTFENTDPSKPIDIYIYLHGHNLIIDQKIDNTFVPKGWALHFHNSDNDTKANGTKFGKIIPGSIAKNAMIDINGSLHLGKSVEFDMIHTTNGVQFLTEQEAQSWIGVVSNHPNK